MTRWLVIGRTGQLAQALADRGGDDVVCAGSARADLRDADALKQAVSDVAPEVVINAGAYTSVDGAESEPDLAKALNETGPQALAEICAQRGIPLIHLSTDCVFDGTKDVPYTPQDTPHPLGVYGQSKYEGELAVRAAAEKSVIVRVSWIFSRYGKNFVRTMLDLARTREEVRVVCDQYGCPTHALSLAEGLLEIAQQVSRPGFDAWGVYHMAGAGETDRASMTERIFETSLRLGGPSARVNRVTTADFPTPAKRPLNARLDMSDTTCVFGVSLPDWTLGLDQTVEELLRETQTS